MRALDAAQAREFAPLPDGATDDQRVPLELLRQLIKPETAERVRWAKRIEGSRILIAMPPEIGCKLIVPDSPQALLEACRPAFEVLRRAAGV